MSSLTSPEHKMNTNDYFIKEANSESMQVLYQQARHLLERIGVDCSSDINLLEEHDITPIFGVVDPGSDSDFKTYIQYIMDSMNRNKLTMKVVPSQILGTYSREEIVKYKDCCYSELFESLNAVDSTDKIKAVLIDSLDRGVTCWESFLKLLDMKYPKCKSLFISQNYSCHFDDEKCIVDHTSDPNNVQKELESAFINSTIKNIFILDFQSFNEKFYKDKICGLNISRQISLDKRILYLESDFINNSSNDDDISNYQSHIDYPFTLANVFT